MADYDKHKDCKWLSTEKCSIGCKCVNPNKTYKDCAMWKQPTGKACSKFEKSDVKRDEYVKVNKNKLQIMLQNLYDPVKAKNTYEYLLK